jgi:hypothetical protein
MKYDPALHTTAKELRDNAVDIPLEIPDHAYVPKDKIRYGVLESTTMHDKITNTLVWNTPVFIDAVFVTDGDGVTPV